MSLLTVVELIQEEMLERHWDIDRMAFEMSDKSAEDWQLTRLSLELLFTVSREDRKHGHRLILGRPMAEQFGRAFDVDPEFLLRLEAALL